MARRVKYQRTQLGTKLKDEYMKKIKLSLAVLAVSVLFAPQAQAREFADIYTECGLGSMIAPTNTTVAAI
ncbi:MAG: Unknown protein, partial [uncultured Sulfurovum sp.]